MPQLVVLAYQVPTETQVEPYGFITLPNQSLPSEIVEQLSPDNSADREAVFAQPHNEFKKKSSDLSSGRCWKKVSLSSSLC